MQKYNPKDIEKKWQDYWTNQGTFEVREDSPSASAQDKKEKFYSLIEFPYPSGAGLHVGHPRPFTAMDVISRKRRMQGYNVLFPIGFDAFGLPTENYAIKTGRPPAEVTQENIANFTRQLTSLGFSFDWSRAVDTTDPEYYKWTQWIFLQLHKHGLAYKKNVPINWCLSCKIGLANEEIVDGKCERCGGEVEKRDKEQWMLAITKYADSLLEGLQTVDYIKRAQVQQENWIGRKEGINIAYDVEGLDDQIVCFTTRPDTNFGATFIVVAPESDFVKKHIDSFSNREDIDVYVAEASKKSDIDRIAEGKKKTGVDTGLVAINNLNGKKMPIYVSDFVLATVGTGAVVGVPGHDLRDFEFAQAKDLEIIRVVVGPNGDESAITDAEQVQEHKGVMMNSEFLDGLDIHEATGKIMDHLEEKGWGARVVNFKLRDWVFSRQRYWGEPIPLVFCEACEKKDKDITSVVTVHAIGSNGSEHWHPWLNEGLQKGGIKSFAPDFPNSDTPVMSEWVKMLDDMYGKEMDENSVLVGRSLGSRAALKFAETHKIRKLILTCTTLDGGDEYWKEIHSKSPEFPVDVARQFNGESIDYKKVQENVEEIIFLFSNNDPYIPVEFQNYYKEKFPEAIFKQYKNAGHFGGSDGFASFPDLIDFIEEKNPGWIPLPESELPLELPQVEKYEPTDTGESPLAAMEEWVKTECPQCGGPARRETDVMPNWAGSSWYWLRYMDPKNTEQLASKEALDYWGQVDWYNGGMEHTVLHLLYSRFWNQFLFDIGAILHKEPYAKRTSHGMILAEDGEKMSKSRGNVVNPDEMIERFGADTLRTYIMFMGPFDQAVAWDMNGLVGVRRFLDRVWNLQERIGKSEGGSVESLVHKTIKKVGDDIDEMKYNTAIAKMMELTNEMTKGQGVTKESYQNLVMLLSPFAPHMCEELWEVLGNDGTIAYAEWPQYDEAKIVEDTVMLAIQINGKVRGDMKVSADIAEADVKAQALAHENIVKWLDGKEPKKVIYVKGKIVSIVV